MNHAHSGTGIKYENATAVPRSRPGGQPHATAGRWWEHAAPDTAKSDPLAACSQTRQHPC